MISLRGLGAAILALAVTATAAAAGAFTIEQPGLSMSLRPEVSARIEEHDQFVPIDMQEESRLSLRFEDESPVDIRDREDRPQLQTRMFESEAVLRCKIDADSSDSLIVANVGSDPVAAGTTIKWQVRASGERGFFALSKDLRAGQSVRARGVLGGGTENSGKCSARAV